MRKEHEVDGPSSLLFSSGRVGVSPSFQSLHFLAQILARDTTFPDSHVLSMMPYDREYSTNRLPVFVSGFESQGLYLTLRRNKLAQESFFL